MNHYLQLNQFGFLLISGLDAQKFLQGYTTCDLEKLGPDEIMRGAICNIQGRMTCNFFAARLDQGFLLRLHRELVEPTISFLKKYIVFSKASLHNASEQYYCYGLTAMTGDVPQSRYQMSHLDASMLCRISPDERFELWSEQQLDANNQHGAWIVQDIDEGVAWLDSQSSEQYLPQMYNLDQLGAIAFDKGCYLGQEIVARMQYRGQLKKRLQLIVASRDLINSEKVYDSNGKSQGEVVYFQGNRGLVVASIEHGDGLRLQDDAEISFPA